MKLLSGKRILITGIASEKSIAYGIAQFAADHGAELILTYQNERFESRIRKMAEQWEVPLENCLECDVASDASIEALVTSTTALWPEGLDGLVHSIGYAPRDQIEGRFSRQTTREGFQIAHDISSYSFIALCSAFSDHLRENSSLLTLSYMGAEKAMPNYNVMGLAKASLEAGVRYLANDLGPDSIRVNAVSAGPIRTLAASGIKGFRSMLKVSEQRTPLRRNVTTEEVGKAAGFLLSDLASGVTGEILHVDAGYNITGMEPISPL